MAETYASPEEAALWAARRRLLLDRLLGKASALAGARVSEANGWLFRGYAGSRYVEVALHRPRFAAEAPECILFLATARDGMRCPGDKPMRHEARVQFAPGSAELAGEPEAVASNAVGWAVQRLIDALPPASSPSGGPSPR